MVARSAKGTNRKTKKLLDSDDIDEALIFLGEYE